MSSKQSRQYFGFLMSSDLIQTDALAGKKYQRTEAGREFLKQYNKMVVLLDTSISSPSLF